MPAMNQERDLFSINVRSACPILVIEDNPGSLLILSTMLELLNCPFDIAEDLHAAFIAMKHTSYKTVFISMGLKEAETTQIAQQVQAFQQKEQMPLSRVVAMTGQSLNTPLESDIQTYLLKPFTIEQLAETLLLKAA